MLPVYGPVGAIGFVAWLLVEGFRALTGPQNLSGWIFFVSLPFGAALIGRIVGSRLERRSRHRV